MLALYHFGPVSNSLTPLLCLKEKALEFEDRWLNSSKFEHHDPAFLKLNPEGMVPVLLHDGDPITESTVINEYLDEVFPEVPLKPATPKGRALMRQWTKYCDEYFYPAITMLGANFATAFASKWEDTQKQKVLSGIANDEVRRKWEHVTGKGYTEAELEDSRRKVRLVVEKMEKRLAATGAWLAGTYSLADIKNYSFAQHVERSVPDALTEAKTPRAYEWLRKMDERPAVKACKAMARPR
ncbi:MAG: glutathione S-transferase family protein [Alphaproteobacteria bacterium]